jgi:hypothetical protein
VICSTILAAVVTWYPLVLLQLLLLLMLTSSMVPVTMTQ